MILAQRVGFTATGACLPSTREGFLLKDLGIVGCEVKVAQAPTFA
jgi:hypothetical protein